MVVGIFGKSGSGKSTVCEYLKTKGFYYIDADKIGHGILKKGEEAYLKVIEAFGTDFLKADGEIDRKKLGKYVFENGKASVLSEITHPIIDKRVADEIKKSLKTHNNTVIDAALLCNTGIKDMCDFTVLVKSENCIERIKERKRKNGNGEKNEIINSNSNL